MLDDEKIKDLIRDVIKEDRCNQQENIGLTILIFLIGTPLCLIIFIGLVFCIDKWERDDTLAMHERNSKARSVAVNNPRCISFAELKNKYNEKCKDIKWSQGEAPKANFFPNEHDWFHYLRHPRQRSISLVQSEEYSRRPSKILKIDTIEDRRFITTFSYSDYRKNLTIDLENLNNRHSCVVAETLLSYTGHSPDEKVMVLYKEQERRQNTIGLMRLGSAIVKYLAVQINIYQNEQDP